jgi:hypothetical protein
MPLNLIEICTVKYPGQIEAGNISFKKPLDEDFSFDTWKVPGIEEPKVQSLLEESSQWELAYNLFCAFNNYLNYINFILNNTARLKQYDNAVSCASYANSTNLQWKAEAEAFIAWRDAVFNYAITIQKEVQDGAPIPDFDTFKNNMPVINW